LTFPTAKPRNPMFGHPPNVTPSMLSESFRTVLFDIRDNIMFAKAFVCGLDYEQFKESRLHFYAATRALEIVSEASRRLPDEVRDRHPHLPWRAIRDAGNIYRHNYDNVEESIVWDTVHRDLPSLLVVVLAEIARFDDAP
jgi:uncharacterized protein with HEPN domain